ncbi:hypothetical protein CLOM_g6519 [Closterium sp. NIES-68]|nr:hypothetical protein CLOM_g6519 [Closterium sp. NIES-68]
MGCCCRCRFSSPRWCKAWPSAPCCIAPKTPSSAPFPSNFSPPRFPFLVLLLPPLALSTGVLRTTYTALLTTSVAQTEVGQLLGLSDAIMSACRVLGPSTAGLVSSQFGYHAPVAIRKRSHVSVAHG